MSIFNKRNAEILENELIKKRKSFVNMFFLLSVSVSKKPLEKIYVEKYIDLIFNDIERFLLFQEDSFASIHMGNNTKNSLVFYSTLSMHTLGYLMCWTKALASVMYYVYELHNDFPDEKVAKEKLYSSLLDEFLKDDCIFCQTKDSFFDYKEFAIQSLYVE